PMTRGFFTLLVGLHLSLRFYADSLPLLATSSYSTCAPSLSVFKPARSTAEICTNTSLPPPCGWMNPYPLVGLNHFTVPLATIALLFTRLSVALHCRSA